MPTAIDSLAALEADESCHARVLRENSQIRAEDSLAVIPSINTDTEAMQVVLQMIKREVPAAASDIDTVVLDNQEYTQTPCSRIPRITGQERGRGVFYMNEAEAVYDASRSDFARLRIDLGLPPPPMTIAAALRRTTQAGACARRTRRHCSPPPLPVSAQSHGAPRWPDRIVAAPRPTRPTMRRPVERRRLAPLLERGQTPPDPHGAAVVASEWGDVECPLHRTTTLVRRYPRSGPSAPWHGGGSPPHTAPVTQLTDLITSRHGSSVI